MSTFLSCFQHPESTLSSFHVIALHPATGCFQRTVFARYHILRFQWLSTATVVVFAHPIRACRPGFTPGYGWKRMFSIGWIFCFQGTPTLLVLDRTYIPSSFFRAKLRRILSIISRSWPESVLANLLSKCCCAGFRYFLSSR